LGRIPAVFVAAAALGLGAGFVRAQEPTAQPPAPPGAIIRTETKVVLVDAVVTDKKGNYVHGLTEKDFKVFEDNKEQKITSFTFEADAASPLNSQKRYIVLFFDNSTMSFGEQAQARDAASKFIETNAGPNRLMAIVNYGGSLQIAQNFTEDAERLKAVVKGVKFSTVSPNATPGVQLSGAMADFGARDMILALRSFAKNLNAVPGRKTLILLTSGFPLANEQISEVQATIDVCNRSNVAIYPIDARGLYVPPAGGNPPGPGPRGMIFAPTVDAWPVHVVLATGQRGSPPPPGGSPSRGPSTGTPSPGTGSPTRGGPTTGSSGGTGRSGVTTTNSGNSGGGGGGVTPRNPLYDPMNNRSRILIPKFPESSSTNQQLLYMLADGTGGFVIVNTNDLLSGMEKIGKEQNEYYLLGYTPPESEEGTCHVLKVKVDHSAGAAIRARTGYCNAKPRDVLAGNTIEKQLETRAAAAQPGNAQASVQAPFFYTASNVARVNVAMEISPETMKFDKDKGKLHGTINVLGVAYRSDGSTAARFSDALKLNFENKKEVEQFKVTPLHYENQFDIAAGQYTLKVVFSTGAESFGKAETPLVIEPYDSSQFTMSGIALSKQALKAADTSGALDAAMLEDRTPLIVQGMQIVPAGSYRFKPEERPVMYLEVYEPLLLAWKDEKPPAIAVQIRLLDRKTGQQKEDTGLLRVDYPLKAGNPVIPMGMKVAKEPLAPGSYRLELTAMDQAGKSFKRTADFEIE
jgi:VWFA-related protein